MNSDLWHLSKKKSGKDRVFVLTYILIHFAVQQTHSLWNSCAPINPPPKKKETCGLTTGSQTPENLATGCYKPVRSGSDTLPQFFSGNWQLQAASGERHVRYPCFRYLPRTSQVDCPHGSDVGSIHHISLHSDWWLRKSPFTVISQAGRTLFWGKQGGEKCW